ncbi:MAG: sulfatase-like hydrolase/transferase [Planctomycetes bacterium]|nr:sulfatase-like hydrolase/transferase [Planctomycetota bacterium]
MNKLFISVGLVLAFAGACCNMALAAAENAPAENSSKPNVIVIMADDLGYHDLGFQGSDHIISPHLDALAAAGTVFTDAHVAASVCSPSRAGFITGRYQTRFGHEANVPHGEDGMATSEFTLGQAFQSIGYRTCVIGKWHLGNMEYQYPTNRGFDDFWGMREGSRSYWYNEKKNDHEGNPRAFEYNGKPEVFDGFFSDVLADKAIAFIETHKEKPFFMFLSFNAPHTPLQAKEEDLKRCDGDPYAALIYNMDMNIGRVVETLEKNEIRSKTMIWFLSDNGGVVAKASNYPLKGTKGLKLEGGHRIPFILNWPGKVAEGEKYDGLTSSLDIFPTSFSAAGGDITKLKNPLDGVNVMPHISGQNGAEPHQKLYWRRLGVAALREGPWKVIRVEGVKAALYNIDKDLGEKKNLAAAMPEKVELMLADIANWEKEMVAPLWGESAKWVKWTHNTHAKLFLNEGEKLEVKESTGAEAIETKKKGK